MKIFVSIASYRDKLLELTIKDAYNKARYKDSLVFGVFEQNLQEFSINPKDFDFSDKIRYTRIDPQYARGCCWARSNIQSMWEGEEYYLQIDSHTIFDDYWDVRLIDNLDLLKIYHNKPIITGYPKGFDFIENGNYNKHQSEGTHGLTARDFPIEENPYFLRMQSVNSKQEITHGFLMSAGFQFTEGKIVEEVPYDPFLFFEGEEQSYTLRCWTRGYNFFHTPNDPIYHLYGTTNKILLWDDKDSDQQRNNHWNEKSNYAKDRLSKLMNEEIKGIYGFGSDRTLRQYESWTGIDFFGKELSEKSKTGEGIFDLDYTESIKL